MCICLATEKIRPEICSDSDTQVFPNFLCLLGEGFRMIEILNLWSGFLSFELDYKCKKNMYFAHYHGKEGCKLSPRVSRECDWWIYFLH